MSKIAGSQLIQRGFARAGLGLALGVSAVAALGEGLAAQTVVVGSEVRWELGPGVPAADVYDRGRHSFERVRVGLRFDGGFFASRPAWAVPVRVFARRAVDVGMPSLECTPLDAFGVGARTLAIAVRGEGEIRLEGGRVQTHGACKMLRAKRDGGLEVLCSTSRGRVVEDRIVLPKKAAPFGREPLTLVFVSVGRAGEDTALRLARLRHGVESWIERAKAQDALLRARGPAMLQEGDPLAAGFELAQRQMQAALAPVGAGLAVFDRVHEPRIFDDDPGALPRREALAQAEVAQAFSLLGYAREAKAMRASLRPFASGAARFFAGDEVDAALPEAKSAAIPCECGRRKAVSTFDAALVHALASQGPCSEAVRKALRARRIPMLLEPMDVRASSSLFLLGTRWRRARPGSETASLLVDHAPSIARSQARALRELLRADGSCGLRGRLRPGARPGPQLDPSPLASAQLAEMRLRFGDVRGARRALEAVEKIRRSGSSSLRSFATSFAEPDDVRSRDTRAAAAFAAAVHALRQAERASAATGAQEPPPIPRLVSRFANDEPSYRWAIARFEAWAQELMKRSKPRRSPPAFRNLKRRLGAEDLAAEVARLRAWTIHIEESYERSLR